MRKQAAFLSAVWAATLLSCPTSLAQDRPVPRLEKSGCVTDVLKAAEAECHTFFTYENRDSKSGPVLELPVAVIGKSDQPNVRPVFYFPGGPGASPMGQVSKGFAKGQNFTEKSARKPWSPALLAIWPE
jgi:hypothetical protein